MDFSAARYHSLMVVRPSEAVEITAETADHVPMALKIAGKSIYGVRSLRNTALIFLKISSNSARISEEQSFYGRPRICRVLIPSEF